MPPPIMALMTMPTRPISPTFFELSDALAALPLEPVEVLSAMIPVLVMRGAPAGRRARSDLRCGGGNGRPPSCDRGAPRYFARFVSDSKSISFSQSERFRSFSEVKPVVGTALRASVT